MLHKQKTETANPRHNCKKSQLRRKYYNQQTQKKTKLDRHTPES